MSRYKSEHTAYSPLKKKYVPLWKLDTNTVTVTHFNADTADRGEQDLQHRLHQVSSSFL